MFLQYIVVFLSRDVLNQFQLRGCNVYPPPPQFLYGFSLFQRMVFFAIGGGGRPPSPPLGYATALLIQSYRDLRAQIKQLIQESRSAYFDKVGSEVYTNPRKFWSLIKTFTKSSNLTVPTTVSLHANDPDKPTVTADKPQVIADLFNAHFQSVQKLPSVDNCSEDICDDIRDRSLFMEGGEGNFFFPKLLKLKAPP